MNEKLDQFKQTALTQGYDPQEIDAFIKLAESQQTVTPQVTYTQNTNPQSQGFNTMGVHDESKQMSRMMTPGERKNILGFNTLGMHDELQQMSRFMSLDEQKNAMGSQPSVMPGKYPVTQPYGNRSSIEKYSGGVNLGADFAVPQNTPLAVPPGEWGVIEASEGWNDGSGNFVRLKNLQTGETIGFEHLNKIGVQPGQKLSGGTVIGLSGGGQSGAGRGNSTGSHASIPYTNPQGQYQDVLKSPYGKYIYGS